MFFRRFIQLKKNISSVCVCLALKGWRRVAAHAICIPPAGKSRSHNSNNKTPLRIFSRRCVMANESFRLSAARRPRTSIAQKSSIAGRRTRVAPQPPLVRLRRSEDSDEPAAFGSIRFPARTMPAKFVHLAPDSKPSVVVSLLVDTWKLATPCAVLALNPPSAGLMSPALDVNSRLNLMLRRGLAEQVDSALSGAPQLAALAF